MDRFRRASILWQLLLLAVLLAPGAAAAVVTAVSSEARSEAVLYVDGEHGYDVETSSQGALTDSLHASARAVVYTWAGGSTLSVWVFSVWSGAAAGSLALDTNESICGSSVTFFSRPSWEYVFDLEEDAELVVDHSAYSYLWVQSIGDWSVQPTWLYIRVDEQGWEASGSGSARIPLSGSARHSILMSRLEGTGGGWCDRRLIRCHVLWGLEVDTATQAGTWGSLKALFR